MFTDEIGERATPARAASSMLRPAESSREATTPQYMERLKPDTGVTFGAGWVPTNVRTLPSVDVSGQRTCLRVGIS